MSTSITVTAVNPIGQGKVSIVTYMVNGKEGKAKAWTDGCPAVGEVVSVDFEKKDGYNGGEQETWIKVPKAGGGGRSGGGAAKSDPEKNKNIADCNKNNNESIRFSNSLNNASKLTELACQLVGKGGDLNQVREIADGLCDITLEIQKRLQGAE